MQHGEYSGPRWGYRSLSPGTVLSSSTVHCGLRPETLFACLRASGLRSQLERAARSTTSRLPNGACGRVVRHGGLLVSGSGHCADLYASYRRAPVDEMGL